MNKEERIQLEKEVEKAVYDSMSDPKYWARKRYRWDEWGSPVGLSLGWAIFIIPLGIFLYLLRLAGLL
jgi:hypothetical protein